jgi:hypothetical protein
MALLDDSEVLEAPKDKVNHPTYCAYSKNQVDYPNDNRSLDHAFMLPFKPIVVFHILFFSV